MSELRFSRSGARGSKCTERLLLQRSRSASIPPRLRQRLLLRAAVEYSVLYTKMLEHNVLQALPLRPTVHRASMRKGVQQERAPRSFSSGFVLGMGATMTAASMVTMYTSTAAGSVHWLHCRLCDPERRKYTEPTHTPKATPIGCDLCKTGCSR
jgi:hypothetical protein